jgi:hypothetical protein
MNGKQLFTIQQFKVALRIDCTAEQIGHLLINYEEDNKPCMIVIV